MITLLKKFKNVLNGIATVQHIADNMIYLNGKNAKIKLIGSDINNLFKILPIIATNNKPLAEVPSGHTFDYDSLIKGSLKEVEFNNEHQLYAMFENCYSNQIVCENLELPQIKIVLDSNNRVPLVNHVYIFDGCLWATDSRYLLKTDLHINKDLKTNIPVQIYNLFKKIVWICKKDNIIQIYGSIDTKHQIVIQYKELELECLDKNINMLRNVSKPLDTCDDGVIYDLTEVTDLKLPNTRMSELVRYNDGLISVYDNTFNYNIKEFKHDFKDNLKKFTVDAYYLKLFKKLFKKASIKTFGTLSGRTTSITMHDNDNSVLIMCIVE